MKKTTKTQLTLCKNAFTLAEVLITLAIIGVVAILTIPNVIEKYNESSWSTSARQFQSRLTIAFKSMLSNGDLNGYNNTYDFVDKGLRKYMNITKICKEDKLAECFSQKFTDDQNEEVSVERLPDTNTLGHDDWGTETIGIQFNNGISAIVAYNPNNEYYQDYIGDFNLSDVFSAIYDVNTYKNPNTVLKDIRLLNASISQKPEKTLLTCDDIDKKGIATTCWSLSSGIIFFNPVYGETDYNSCKSFCEGAGARLQTEADMQARCAEGHGFPWWHWVDDGSAGTSATGIYGSTCNSKKSFPIGQSNISCACAAN